MVSRRRREANKIYNHPWSWFLEFCSKSSRYIYVHKTLVLFDRSFNLILSYLGELFNPPSFTASPPIVLFLFLEMVAYNYSFRVGKVWKEL
jgi:hypothetical protein